MTSTHVRHTLGLLLCTSLLAGCGTPAGNGTQPANQAKTAGAVYQIGRSTYDAAHQKVNLTVAPAPAQPNRATGDLIDVGSSDGLTNYATSAYADKTVREVNVTLPSGSRRMAGLATQNTVRLTHNQRVVIPGALSRPVRLSSVMVAPAGGLAASAAGGRVQLPPPGVRIDRSIRPAASMSESAASKTNAVLSVARNKIGAPYIWGHNEDRGQLGFDCSNFTEYVYHHALGYLMTTSSRGQYANVGVAISRSQMQPGDLVIFESGKHVGIYAGNNRVIQDGGGLKKVGYVSVSPASYWGHRITVVKRLY